MAVNAGAEIVLQLFVALQNYVAMATVFFL
jgi:hypothetical protein